MTTNYRVTELFCVIDEFCKHFDAENAVAFFFFFFPEIYLSEHTANLEII